MTRTAQKFNTSEILKAAWSHYRACFSRMDFNRELFAGCLQEAWADAKRALEPVTETSARVRSLQYQLAHVDKLSFQRNSANEAARIRDELARLAA